jgi:hypothetical protein
MNSIRCLAAVGTVAFSLVAFAQQAPLPAGTSASVAPARLQYRSAFEGYRAYQEPTPRSWREVNEEVAALAGHAGHLKPAGTSTAPQVTKPDATGATGDAAPAALPAAVAKPTKPASAASEGNGK